VDKADH